MSQLAEVANWSAFMVQIAADAQAAGLDHTQVSDALDGLVADPDIATRLTKQPEHERGPADYLNRLVSNERIARGTSQLAEHDQWLCDIEARFAVPRAILVAIWGIESNYGELPGSRDVLRSLATLGAEDTRRASFWQRELLAALKILERGDVTRDQFVGSWAGASGHTQFMPSTYLEFGIDFDADTRADIWSSPRDALASAANYLRASGWRTPGSWGMEVQLPGAFAFEMAREDVWRSIAEWHAEGVIVPRMPIGLTQSSLMRLALPAGWRGPAFALSQNFQALLQYNRSIIYALSVGHLADRIAGNHGLVGQWPTIGVLDREQRIAVQKYLTGMGLDTGGIDGILGSASQAAIRHYQKLYGLRADGTADRALLEHMQSQPNWFDNESIA